MQLREAQNQGENVLCNAAGDTIIKQLSLSLSYVECTEVQLTTEDSLILLIQCS